ncbi:MAG: cytidylate kinase-like family protein [Candidatus Zixiibacteriota bacterium]
MSVITVTRGSLSTSFRLTSALSELLGCRSVSREEVIKHADRYDIQATGLAEQGVVESKPPHFWDRHAAQRRQYLTIFRAALMDFVVDGNVIYHGHLGQFLLPDVPKLLRVRADASLEYRVRVLMRESGRSEAEARAYINEVDSRRINWARFLYGVDFNNPANFDLVLNMDKMSIDTMASIVAHAAEQPEFKYDEAALKLLKSSHLKAHVLAALARSPRTRGMEVTVDANAESGHVSVRGMAPPVGGGMFERDIRDVLATMDAVKSLDVSTTG